VRHASWHWGVRSGLITAKMGFPRDVRSPPDSDHGTDIARGPKSACQEATLHRLNEGGHPKRHEGYINSISQWDGA
jgi:hypothetical protein